MANEKRDARVVNMEQLRRHIDRIADSHYKCFLIDVLANIEFTFEAYGEKSLKGVSILEGNRVISILFEYGFTKAVVALRCYVDFANINFFDTMLNQNVIKEYVKTILETMNYIDQL